MPPPGIHSIAICAVRSLDNHTLCPAGCHRQHLTMSCRQSMHSLLVTSSMVMTSLYEMPNINAGIAGGICLVL